MSAITLEELRRLRADINATRRWGKSDPVNGGAAYDCPYRLAREAFAQAARDYVVALLDGAPPPAQAPSSVERA